MAKRSTSAVYARGEETRARILDAAVQLFGRQGFDGVTTRMIAQAADVPAPSLRYYFENKQGLYVACLVHLQGLLLGIMEPALVNAERLLADETAERMHLVDAFCTMQESLVDHMIGDPESEARALFIVRHDLPSVSGESRFTGDGTVAFRMMTCFTQIVQRISGNNLDSQSALLVAGLVNGQLTTLYIRRHRLADIGIPLVGDRLRWVKRTIRQQTAAVLMMHSG